MVRINRVHADGEHLDIAFFKLGFDLRDRTQFRRANGRIIRRVGKQDTPRVAEPLMEINLAFGSGSFEIGCDIA